MAFGAVVLAPLWEEIFFRGFLLPSLATCMPLPAALLLTSLFFGLGHEDRWLPTSILGLVLGAAYAATGNLLAPIFLHFINNACIVALAYRWPDNGGIPSHAASSTAKDADDEGE